MKTITKTILATMVALSVLSSCDGDDENRIISDTLKVNDFSTTIDENSATGTELGKLADSNQEGISYSIKTQNPEGAIAVSEAGVITIANQKQFDYETNPTIKATIEATKNSSSKELTVTINLNNIDDLLSILSTSKSKYETANSGDWIEITEVEYNKLYSDLNETAKAGFNDDQFNTAVEDRDDIRSYYTTIAPYGETINKIAARAYTIAFKYVNRGRDSIRTKDQVKTSAKSDPSTGYVDLGGKLPSHTGDGVHYFMLKGNTLKNSAEGNLAFYSSSGIGYSQISGISHYHNGYNSGNANDLPNNEPSISFHIQAITTTQMQW